MEMMAFGLFGTSFVREVLLVAAEPVDGRSRCTQTKGTFSDAFQWPAPVRRSSR